MEEEWPPTPGGRPMAAVQVEEEPEVETESQRATEIPTIWGARVMERSHEAMAGRHLTKAELEEQGSPVELVDQRWRRGS